MAVRKRAMQRLRGTPSRPRRRPASRPAAASPGGPPVTPVFEALAIRLEAGRPATAVQELARRLPGAWQVRPVASELGEYELVTTRPVAPGRAWELARRLRRHTGIEDAEPLFQCAGLEPDPARLDACLAPHERTRALRQGSGRDRHKACARSDSLWSVKAVHAPEAWARLPDPPGQDLLVGHPDTGYTQHPEIWGDASGPVLASLGRDFVAAKADPVDPLTGQFPGHGTATASVIMSPTGVARPPGVTGIAPGAAIVPLRVSSSVIHLSFSNLTRAIYHAVDVARVHLLSMSLGGPIPSRALERAVLYAIERGVIPLAAAGNVWPWVVYPAKYEQVIAVAASNCASGKWQGSASGGAVDLTAPGESVWRAQAEQRNGAPSFGVDMSSGTSYAVATVAGACALWLAFHGRAALLQRYGAPALTAVFRRVVTQSGCSAPPGWDTRHLGAGILDASKLLAAPLPAAATGVRSNAPRGVLEAAVDFFPQDDPDRVVHALSRRVPPVRGSRAAAVRNALADFGDELLFHLGTNPALRAAIHIDAAASTRRATVTRVPLDASRRFRAAFGF